MPESVARAVAHARNGGVAFIPADVISPDVVERCAEELVFGVDGALISSGSNGTLFEPELETFARPVSL